MTDIFYYANLSNSLTHILIVHNLVVVLCLWEENKNYFNSSKKLYIQIPLSLRRPFNLHSLPLQQRASNYTQ